MNTRLEYSADRLRAEIRRLEAQITELQLERDAERSQLIVAEILLCVISGIAGYLLGLWAA